MSKTYHILNGDALLAQFPASLEGERIVARECLVDGPVTGNTLKDFFATRATFLREEYNETEAGYRENVISQFEGIQKIVPNSTVCLWFEQDLFCQVNLWFVAWLLHSLGKPFTIFLVKPPHLTPYGFGGLDTEGLLQCFEKRTPLLEVASFAQLWEAYQQDDLEVLLQTSKNLQYKYSFLLPAVEAHLERKPTTTTLGRPKESIQTIMKELDTQAFGPIFREFHQREAIYGFGDLQVKRLYDELLAR